MHKVNANFDDYTRINSECIKDFFRKHIFEKFNPFFLPDNYCEKNSKVPVIYPEQNLFIWCILFNESEIAKLFWYTGEVDIKMNIYLFD